MATIKPFRALHPNSCYADRLVFPSDEQVFYFGTEEKKQPLLPLKAQLEAPARIRPETTEGQEQAYRKIRESLECLLKLERISKDEQPGIYIYEIVHRNYRQTGIWAMTSIRDFFDGKIKLHEHTIADSERRICNYRKHTGLEGSPVLLTYQPDITINRIIAETCANTRKSTVGNRKSLHRIWKIGDSETLHKLTAAFTQVETVYMADGHHRLASTARLALESGSDVYISSLYIAADQLRIMEFYRVVIPDTAVNDADLFSRLGELFTIVPSEGNLPVKPTSANILGVCIHGKWHKLHAKLPAALDVVLLQDEILAKVFRINDPRNDTRLLCIGGENAMEETLALLKAEPSAIAFTLFPISVKQLISAADAGQILPPKSTWIDPKVPYGLLMYQHPTVGYRQPERQKSEQYKSDGHK
jgi:uncharacterized protein (DUF1015 family)